MVRDGDPYESEPDAERYARTHDGVRRQGRVRAFRHGKAFGSPFGEPAFAYYAEFEWADMDAFKRAARSEAFAASGKDAMEMGIPFTVTFVELE